MDTTGEPSNEKVGAEEVTSGTAPPRRRRKTLVIEQDGGRMEVPEAAIGAIVRKELSEIDGMSAAKGSLWGWVRSMLNPRYVPGYIKVKQVDGGLHIDVKVCLRFGTNLPAKAQELRDRVTRSVEQTVGCAPAQLNVIVDRVDVNAGAAGPARSGRSDDTISETENEPPRAAE